MDALVRDKGWSVKADGPYFRRVVPSPQPKRIVESDAITALIQRDHLVICNGGGGVPVVEKADGYHGIEAVIDKDLSAALLARQIEADALLILTDADAVYLNWGTPTQRPLTSVTPAELESMSFDARLDGAKSVHAVALLPAATVSPGSAPWKMARQFWPGRKAR